MSIPIPISTSIQKNKSSTPIITEQLAYSISVSKKEMNILLEQIKSEQERKSIPISSSCSSFTPSPINSGRSTPLQFYLEIQE